MYDRLSPSIPTLPAITDERGTLTYRQVDEMSSALARGLGKLGVSEGSVVAMLCRDHRGLIIGMATCGKLGSRRGNLAVQSLDRRAAGVI